MKKDKNIFDVLKNITFNKDKDFYKNLSETERKNFNIFMLQRYISMEKKYISFISYIDKYAFNCLDKEMYHDLMLKVLPKKGIYFNYIKKDKNKEKEDIVIDYIVEKYEISKQEAKEYNQLLTKEDKQELLMGFGVEEKIVKKIK